MFALFTHCTPEQRLRVYSCENFDQKAENDRKGARRGAGGRPEHKQNSLLTQRKHRVQHVGQPSLLSFSLLGEVLFLVRRLFEQPRLSTSHCSVY
eukprot:Transcript_7223.p2 GENE.Transcript_7223~~Transcript_7223.p2  ORF type:complete len:95 (+),score=7.88 Transcript_7223:40-324(+)